MTLADNPTVNKLANSGVPWAVKVVKSGWTSLTKNQKAAARKAIPGIGAAPVVRPTQIRLVNGNPSNAIRRKDQPGNINLGTTITRTECIASVSKSVSVTGSFSSWVVDPRNGATFPVTKFVAAMYNKYRVAALKIRYSPKCSKDTNGGIVIGFSSDSTDAIPSTKYDLYNLKQHADSAVNASVILSCVNSDMGTRLLRDSSDDDGKLVDYGRITTCVYGQAASDTDYLGELFLEYTIVFSEPQTNVSLLQSGVLTSSTGPGLCRLINSPSSLTWVFNSPGRFFLSFDMSIPLRLTPTTTNTTSSNTVLETGDYCVGYTLLTTDVPGSTLSFPTDSVTTRCNWYCTSY